VSRYQKGKTNLDSTEARDSEWQWHQLGHMQVCTSLQTDNHASTRPLSFFTGRMPFLPPNQRRQSTEGTYRTLIGKKPVLEVEPTWGSWTVKNPMASSLFTESPRLMTTASLFMVENCKNVIFETPCISSKYTAWQARFHLSASLHVKYIIQKTNLEQTQSAA